MEFFSIPAVDIEKLVLIMARVAAVLFFAPVFDNQSFPNLAKVGLSLVISLSLFPVVEFTLPLITSPYAMLIYVGCELMIGVVIGFAIQIIFGAVQTAGQVAGFQMGLGIVAVIDPFTQSRSSVVSQLYNFMTVLLFFTLDAHHMLLRALQESFRVMPFGGWHLSEPMMNLLIGLSGQLFSLAIQIAAPVIAINFFVSVALGLMARTVPQMNVFIVGFPLKIGVGLAAIGLSMSFFSILLQRVFTQSEGHLHALIRAM